MDCVRDSNANGAEGKAGKPMILVSRAVGYQYLIICGEGVERLCFVNLCRMGSGHPMRYGASLKFAEEIETAEKTGISSSPHAPDTRCSLVGTGWDAAHSEATGTSPRFNLSCTYIPLKRWGHERAPRIISTRRRMWLQWRLYRSIGLSQQQNRKSTCWFWTWEDSST